MLNPGGPPQHLPSGAAGGFPGSVLFQQTPPPQPPQQPPQQQQPFQLPAATGFIPIIGHRHFMARYQDASIDPYQGIYNGQMNVFDMPCKDRRLLPPD
jgi:hypothetical protein